MDLNVLRSMLISSFLVSVIVAMFILRPLDSFAVCPEKWQCCRAAVSGVRCEAVC